MLIIVVRRTIAIFEKPVKPSRQWRGLVTIPSLKLMLSVSEVLFSCPVTSYKPAKHGSNDVRGSSVVVCYSWRLLNCFTNARRIALETLIQVTNLKDYSRSSEMVRFVRLYHFLLAVLYCCDNLFILHRFPDIRAYLFICNRRMAALYKLQDYKDSHWATLRELEQ